MDFRTRGLGKVSGPVRNLKSDAGWREYLPPASLQIQNLIEPQEDEEGGITVTATSAVGRQKMLLRFDGQHWTAQPMGVEKVRYAWRGPGKTSWAATSDSLLQLDELQSKMTENDEISAGQYFDVATEPGGNFWLATSDGLFRYALPTWRIPASVEKVNSFVHCLTEDSEGRLWFISGSGLHALQNDLHQEYSLPGKTARDLQSARALFPLKNGMLLLDTGDQLFRFDPWEGSFNAVPERKDDEQVRPLGLLKDGSVCVQSFKSGPVEGNYELEVFDGAEFQSFPYPSPDAVFGGKLYSLCETKNGDLWLGGDQGIAWCHNKKWLMFPASPKYIPETVSGFIELPDGRVWCATQDKIWACDGRNWPVVQSGFDHINTLLCARDGSVWVASNGGLYHLFRGACGPKRRGRRPAQRVRQGDLRRPARSHLGGHHPWIESLLS